MCLAFRVQVLCTQGAWSKLSATGSRDGEVGWAVSMNLVDLYVNIVSYAYGAVRKAALEGAYGSHSK
jgi:hypothetical protein